MPDANRIRTARQALHLSQAEVAARADVATNTYLNFELGRRTPQATNLARILEILQLDDQGDSIEVVPADQVVAALEASDLALWRRHAVLAEYHRHRLEQELG